MNEKIINKRYKIISEIGSGGMGHVYLVNDILHQNETLALKIIKKELINPLIVKNFKKEFEVMTRLIHPNLIKVFDFGFSSEDEVYYITMEYVKGFSLRDILVINDKNHLDFDTKIKIMVDLCRSLDFIHSRKIIHRDIKPGNIIISEDNIAKLMDFGLADLELVDDKQSKGTLVYMAPEVLAGRSDHRVDIYALGVTCYEMFANTSFYLEKQSKSILESLKDDSKFDHEVHIALEKIDNDDLKKIIEKMIAYDKDARYKSGAEIIVDINKFLSYNYEIETKSTTEAYLSSPIFVDRINELELLKDSIKSDETVKKFFVINGGPGLGKSRIFHEFKKYCQLEGIKFFETSGIDRATKTYDALIDILSEIIIYSSDRIIKSYGSEIKKIIPFNQRLINVKNIATYDDPKLERDILIQAISNLIIDFAKENNSKIAIYIDDLNFIDDGSIAIIDELIYKIFNQGIKNLLICGSYREENNKIFSFLDKLRNKNRIFELSLQPFKEEDVSSYFSAIFGANSIGDSLKNIFSIISQKVGGNPFFLQETIKLLVKEGFINRVSTKWELIKPIEDIIVPENLKDIVKVSISKYNLSDKETVILQKLAVINKSMTIDEFCKIINYKKQDDLNKYFNKFLFLNILQMEKEDDKILYKFLNNMIREILYENISDNLKEKYHLEIAKNLEKIYEDNLEDYIEEIAYHYSFTKNIKKSILYIKKAAIRAKDNYANEKAIFFYKKLLNLYENIVNDETIEIYLSLGEIYDLIAKWTDGIEMFNKALELATELKNKLLSARAKLGLGKLIFKKGEEEKGFAILNEALEINESIKNKEGISKVLGEIINYHINKKNYNVALELINKKLELDESIKNNLGILFSLGRQAIIYNNIGEYSKSKELAEKELSLAKSLNNKYFISDAYGNLARYYNATSEFGQSIECYKTQLNIVKEFGDKRLQNVILNNLAINYRQLGDYDLAQKNYEYILQTADEMGDLRAIAVVKGNMGIIFELKADYKKAMECYEEKIKIAEKLNNKAMIITTIGNIGNLYINLKKYKEALNCFLEENRLAKEHNEKSREMASGLNIGIANYFLNNYEEAEKYMNNALIEADKLGDKYFYALSLEALSYLYRDKGEYDKALEFSEKSFELKEKMGQKDIFIRSNIFKASVYFYKGDYKTALSVYDDLNEREVDNLHNKNEIIAYYGDLAFYYQAIKDYNKALIYYDRLISIIEKLDLKEEYYNNLIAKAEILIELNRYKDAKIIFDKCCEIIKNIDEYKKVKFDLNMLNVKLIFYFEKNLIKAEEELKKNESLIYDDISAATYYRESFKLFPKEEYRLKAIESLEKLYNYKKMKLYYDMLEELKNIKVEKKVISSYEKIKSKLEDLKKLVKENNEFFEKEIEAAEKKNITFNNEDFYFISELLNIIKEINKNLNLKILLQKIVDLSVEFIGANRGFLLLRNKQGIMEINVARNNKKENIPIEECRLTNTIIQKVIQTGNSIFISDVKQRDSVLNVNSISEMKLRSIMCIPLSLENKRKVTNEKRKYHIPISRRFLGVLYTDSENVEEKGRFKEINLKYLEILAEQAAIAISNATIYEKRNIDILTGLYLRPYMEEMLENEISLSKEFSIPITFMILDIDNFKSINEKYGYQAGNQILKIIGEMLSSSLRSSDLCARYGGEEFAIILPNTDKNQAEVVAKKLQDIFINEVLSIYNLTLSIGYSTYNNDNKEDSLELIKNKLIYSAETALSECQKKGGNGYFYWDSNINLYNDNININKILTGDPIRDYRNVEKLLQAIKVVSSTLDLNELLVSILDMILEITESERAILMLLDNNDKKLKIRLARSNRGENLPENKISFSQSIVNKVYQTGKPICLKEVEESSASDSIINLDIFSVMCIPLQVKEKIFGVVYVDSKSSLRQFTDADLSFFNALASQIAGAIENAKLYEETLEMSNKIKIYNENLIKRENELIVTNKEIKSLKDYLSNIITYMPSMLASLDLNGVITQWNLAAEKYTGIKINDAIGKVLWDILPEFKNYKVYFEAVLQDKSSKELMREKISLNNESKYFNLAIFPIKYDENLIGVVFRLDDYTEIEKKEEQLRQSQKMELIGNLSGGLAHDFNNVLGGIVGVLSLIDYKLAKKGMIEIDELKEYLKTMMNSANRAANMVQQLLALARKHDLNFTEINISKSIKQVVKLCQNTFDKRIEIITQLPSEPAIIKGDATQLEQVLLNLFVNSSHAMTIMRKENEPQGGQLIISLENIYADKSFCEFHTEAKEGNYWVISVKDTGVGMDKNTLSKIFNPFFTTKAKGVGTGLGLSMVYNIIKQHNGFIEVFSEVGIGTTFNIFLPVLEVDKKILEDKKSNKSIPKGEGLILVIDDDEVIRKTAKVMLELCGYTVIQAENGIEAIEIYKEKYKEIKLVLMDIIMPKMSGKETFLELKKINPDIIVIVNSGFKKDEIVQEILKEGAKEFIQKPYTLEKLANTIKKVLKNEN